MNIPANLTERLSALGVDPKEFSSIYEKRGEKFFLSFLQHFIERREQTVSLCSQWGPKLRELATKCRAHDPCPETRNLSPKDLAKLSIYKTKIAEAERLHTRKDIGVIICSIPLIGVSTAQCLWPGEDQSSVILTPEELKEWSRIYRHPEGAHEWWINYWWNIEERPDPKSVLYRRSNITVPEGEIPWVVISGLSWGPLAGGVTHELWSWNGQIARFHSCIADITF